MFGNTTRVTFVMLWLVPAAASGQGAHSEGPAPNKEKTSLTLAQKAEARFPQPVRVGDLGQRLVLEPSSHQGVLGRVDGVARAPDGSLGVLVRYGGVLGVGTRLIAIPVEATALLGQFLEVVDLDETQLGALPPWPGGERLAANATIRIGVTRN